MKQCHRIPPGVALGVLFLFALALLTGSAWAQGNTSSVRGTVMDPQGSVVPNATITLTSLATNAVRTQKSGAAGTFSFELLPPGDYRLQVSAPHFRTTDEVVHALIARPTEIEVRLQIGAAAQVVTVSAESTVQVNTQDAGLGNNIVFSQIAELPLEAKNVLGLLTLQPGVTSDGYVAGARRDQSNITLDGVNINDAQTNDMGATGAAAGQTVLRLNAEAIEEFRVNTMTASPAASRSAGAQITMITKSGTNKFRGSLFDYHRNTLFEANNWFSNHAIPKVPRQALLRDTFGGAFGGPLKKDKLFFFYSFEGRRDRSSQAVTARQVPLPSLAQGYVTFPDTRCATCTTTIGPADIAAIFPDTGGINPASLTGLAVGTKYTPNSTAVGDGYNTKGFIFNALTPVHLNSHVARFDYNISSRQSIFARLNVIYDHDASAALPRFPDTPKPLLWSHPWGIAAAHTWTISDHLVNNFTYGLTREAFSQTGDTIGDTNFFRLVFEPYSRTRTLSRTTPVHNFVNDLAWVRGKHTFHFGVNITLVANNRTNYVSAWDVAYTNPSGYKTNLIYNAVNQYLMEKYGYKAAKGGQSAMENAITALLGRFNNYTANFTFDSSGKLLPSGTPTMRSFATQGYEGYAQDTWKVTPNLTLTYGLRYSLWRPAYERNGYEVQPTIPLGEYFRRRVVGMNIGQPYTELITINPSGPVNSGPPLYNWDKTVFLPKVAVAWSPHPGEGLLGKLLGRNGQSVIRGGFALINDYFGPAIATYFDNYNTLGFLSSQVIPVNTFNVGCGHYVMVGNGLTSCTPILGPLYSSFSQPVRTMPLISPPANLKFPLQKPAVTYPTAIESSLDSQLQTPRDYAWNLTYERELPHGAVLQLSYLGRAARHLLAQRDIATPINLKDPKSGMTWYQAATILEKARQAGTPVSQIAAIPYFENLFPGLAANMGFNPAYTSTQAVYNDAYRYNANDWTTTMLDIDGLSNVGAHAFYQPQYGALDTWATIGNSNYHALAVSYRQRLKDLTVDVNYTYSHSLDDASGLQANATWSNSALILNPFQQRDNYKSSGFDMRHIINLNSVWRLPVGRGKYFLGNASGVVNAILGGWQLSNIFRWNTGQPFGAPYDAATWATNWQVQSYTTVLGGLSRNGCQTRLVATPKFFGNCVDEAYAAFRPSYPGDTGDRNYFTWPSYFTLDFGLGKVWNMPYDEHHSLQFRWDVFNTTNTQPFGSIDTSRNGWGVQPGPGAAPAGNFSNFTGIQGNPRVMQFGLVYRF